MPRRRISSSSGAAALRDWAQAPDDVDRSTMATAVRFLLQELTEHAPGNAVEVRVPPFGAAQCRTGPTHSRGTPPNVVEVSPQAWLRLATGATSWSEASAAGEVSASGVRADLGDLLPLLRL